MIRLSFAAASAALLLAAGAPSAAADQALGAGVTAPEIASWLQSHAITASVVKDEKGKDEVKESGTINWDVNLYDCNTATPARCKSIQFSAGWSGTYTIPQANSWNRDWRYLKSYVTDDGKAIWIDYDLKLTQGMGYADLNEHLDKWIERSAAFRDYIIPTKSK